MIFRIWATQSQVTLKLTDLNPRITSRMVPKFTKKTYFYTISWQISSPKRDFICVQKSRTKDEIKPTRKMRQNMTAKYFLPRIFIPGPMIFNTIPNYFMATNVFYRQKVIFEQKLTVFEVDRTVFDPQKTEKLSKKSQLG